MNTLTEAQPATCDGLQEQCDREATHHVVLAFLGPEVTPPYLTSDLCDACYATWISWQERVQNERGGK